MAMLVCRFYSAHIPWPMANLGGCSMCGFSSQGELSARLLELAVIHWIIIYGVEGELPYLPLYVYIKG